MKNLFSKSAVACNVLPLSGLATLTGLRTLTAFEEPVSGKSGKYNQFTSKNIIKFSIILLMFCSTSVVFGQTPTPPPVSVKFETGGKDYFQHGHNSSGLVNPGQEERDSVTVSSVMKYFVLPDPKVSPNYKYDTPENLNDFTKVNSTFAWSLKTPLGTTDGSTTPIVTITWDTNPTTTGVDTLKVLESPNLSSTCIGTNTAIPVAVINKPTIAFSINGSLYADSACYTQTQVTAGVKRSLGMSVNTESSQVWVDYTVTKDGLTDASLAGTNKPIVGGNLNIEFTDYGRYVITITKVTDRVSRKSTDGSGYPITGNITPAGAKFSYHVMRPIQTGPIYRLPNNL